MREKLRRTVLAISLAAGLTAPVQAGLSPAERHFVDSVVQHHDLNQLWVEHLLENARHDDSIIEAISRPAEAMPWHRYRRIFLTDRRIAEGVAYWHDNEKLLNRVEQEFGVPPQVITAIIGIETLYGTNMGRHRVIDALKTLGFGYPKRAEFFREELEHFLLLSRHEGFDPLVPVGSYAGAMGKPQFISSSYRAYAVDYDEDGRRDLWHSDADVVASIGNYLSEHGWRRGEPVAQRVDGDPADLARLDTGGSKPDRTVAEFLRRGIIVPDTASEPDQRAVLVGLEQENTREYWLGYDNFYAITRYNHSNLYAMAVHQLSEAIHVQRTVKKVTQ